MATITGNESNNVLEGTIESNAIFGGGGNDIILAFSGDDRIYGEEGNDFFVGAGGNDTVVGGNGNDTLSGTQVDSRERERDTLFGGGGNDIFRLGSNGDIYYDSHTDSDLAIIEDFQSGEDKIQLTGSADLYTLTSSGSNTNIYAGEDELIAIVKSNPDLSFADVDFV